MATESGILEMEDVEKMKVTDLRRELKIRGLSTIGNKGDLVERLQLSLHAVGVDVDAGAEEEVNEDDVLGDVDEILAEDPKGDSSLNLTEDEIIMSPVKPSPPQILQIGNSVPSLVRKKTATVAPITSTKPITVTESKEADKVSPVVVASAPVTKTLSAEDRFELRAKRFNVPATEDTRKQARAERFGTQTKIGSNPAADSASLEKLQQRAERFGQVVSPSIKQLEENHRLLKRKERFGAVVATTGKIDGDDKKMKRADRFGLN